MKLSATLSRREAQSLAMERRRRSLVKALGYRALMVVTSVLVTYWLSGEVALSLEVGVVLNAVNLAVYYGYERAWARVDWAA